MDSPTFAAMRAAVEHFDPDGHVVPYCMSGGTDAKQFSRLGITGYGFSPLKLPEGFDYQALFHGVDERVPGRGAALRRPRARPLPAHGLRPAAPVGEERAW